MSNDKMKAQFKNIIARLLWDFVLSNKYINILLPEWHFEFCSHSVDNHLIQNVINVLNPSLCISLTPNNHHTVACVSEIFLFFFFFAQSFHPCPPPTVSLPHPPKYVSVFSMSLFLFFLLVHFIS